MFATIGKRAKIKARPKWWPPGPDFLLSRWSIRWWTDEVIMKLESRFLLPFTWSIRTDHDRRIHRMLLSMLLIFAARPLPINYSPLLSHPTASSTNVSLERPRQLGIVSVRIRIWIFWIRRPWPLWLKCFGWLLLLRGLAPNAAARTAYWNERTNLPVGNSTSVVIQVPVV